MIISPCISICRTNPKTGYCYGCGRNNDEKRNWKLDETGDEWKKANIEKVELGQKGGSIKFKGNKFNNPNALVSLIQSNHKNVKLRPDQSLIYMFDIPRKEHNIERIINLVKEITDL